MPLNESFGAWEPDFLPYENWPAPAPKGIVTTSREFADSNGVYGVAIPTPVNPTNESAFVSVQHAIQFFRAGSTNIGSGVLMKQHTLQYCRGLAREY